MTNNWINWIPPTPLAKTLQERFANQELWEQEELFASLPGTPGLTRDDFFRQGMHDNEDWPWTTFKAKPDQIHLKTGCRYLRRRPSWNPILNNESSDDPYVSSAKQVLDLIETALTYGPMLSHHNKHSTIVMGNLVRLRDRVRNELERLQ